MNGKTLLSFTCVLVSLCPIDKLREVRFLGVCGGAAHTQKTIFPYFSYGSSEQNVTKRNGILGNGAIAILLACLTAILLTATARDIGLTWDEPAYIAGADSYAAWFGVLVRDPARALRSGSIEQYWSVNSEHPPVEKIWSGLVWSLARHVFDDLTANRLGVILLVSLLVALLYLLVAQAYGKAAGLFAALALMSMPRFFFHAHLAALDVPAAVAAFAVTHLFWKTIDRRGWAWGLVLGLAWGLAVAVKLNGVFIPIALVLWCLAFRRKWYVALRIVLMGLTAMAVFWLVWPWLYHNTWDRILAYVDFHVNHFEIGQWYLGRYSLPPPWHFPLVMLWAVVPLTVLVLALIGLMRAGKGARDRGLVWLLILSAIVSLSPFLISSTLKYDNDRLFMPVYPFLAALAGIGFGWLLQGLRRIMQRWERPRLTVASGVLLGAVLLAPQSAAMAGLYPHLLSYYSEGLGGLPGATRLGLETTYWCETYASALPYINAHASPGDLIWVEPWSFDILFYYQMHGWLRKDVFILNDAPARSILGAAAPTPVIGDIHSADWVIFQYRQSQFRWDGEDYPPYLSLKDRQLVYDVSYQGVPLMGLFTR
jgi:4-amino-4-deoxy-L-arabinose transferase-like glycosyltransferase